MFGSLRFWTERSYQQIVVPHDHANKIVEVMCNPARETPYGFNEEAVRLNALGERSTPHRHTSLPLPLWGEVTSRNPFDPKKAER
jgi:hypothetical protein